MEQLGEFARIAAANAVLERARWTRASAAALLEIAQMLVEIDRHRGERVATAQAGHERAQEGSSVVHQQVVRQFASIRRAQQASLQAHVGAQANGST